MKIKVNGETYECLKITGKKYDLFCEAMENIEKRQLETGKGYSKEDLKLMRETLVELYDNKFNSEDIYNDMDTAEVIYAFMETQIELGEKLNNKISKISKNYQSTQTYHHKKKK